MKEPDFSRRDFINLATVAGAGAFLSSCGGGSRSFPKLSFLDRAPDGQPLKAGLIGCGGRGTGSAQDFLKAGPNLQVVALADMFQDRLDKCRKTLAQKANAKVEDSRCFVGFDAYKKVIDSDVDVVLMATPPYFRPMHFEAAVDAKKHVFMEKPVGVDPVGIRQVLATAERAKAYNLCVVTGTQRRHERPYLENYEHVKNGAIGRILAGRIHWNGGQLWYEKRREGWTDMEAMLRDWVNWTWLSGDHYVEQHVHNIDVMNWFTGKYPVKALGMGARMRRPTGDQYDFFCVYFSYDGHVDVQSTARQIHGCKNEISEFLMGSDGFTNCKGTIWNKDGEIAWQYQEESKDPAKKLDPEKSAMSPYVQEHIDMVAAIRANKPINEAENTAKSTLTAIMGRMSAYSGQEVTWEQAMSSELKLGPKELVLGPVPDIKAEIPIPGAARPEIPKA